MPIAIEAIETAPINAVPDGAVVERFTILVSANGRDGWLPSPFEYATGAEAAHAAKALNDSRRAAGLLKRFRVKKVVRGVNTWQEREAWRMANGVYKPVPWADRTNGGLDTRPFGVKDHYCHLSADKPGYVAYTPDGSFGERDAQRRVKASKYLNDFWRGWMSAEDITAYTRACGEEPPAFEVHFAHTPDEIQAVYERSDNGPCNSCMSHPAATYAGDFHPTRVYGAGDLAVAYTATGPLDDADTTITARVLVWPDKKQFSTSYGYPDARHPLLDWLREKGYKAGDLEGARLLRVERNGVFHAPYLDNAECVTDRGDYLIIDSDGPIACRNTNGLSDAGCQCPACFGVCDEDDMVYIANEDQSICPGCYRNGPYSRCEDCDVIFNSDDSGAYVDGHGHVCQRCVDRHYFSCAHCGETFNDDDAVSSADGNICQSCYETHYWTCNDCGEAFPNGATQHAGRGGQFVCDGCHKPDDSEEEPAPTIETLQPLPALPTLAATVAEETPTEPHNPAGIPWAHIAAADHLLWSTLQREDTF